MLQRKTPLIAVAAVALAAVFVLAPRLSEPPDALAANVFSTPDVEFMDDFLGTEFLKSEAGSDGVWSTTETALNNAIAVDPDAENGVLVLQLDADVNAEEATLHWNDQRGIDLNQDAYVEMRVQATVLPTLTAEAVFGLAGDRAATADAVAEHAWFKLDGSGAVVMESDDTTNDNDDAVTNVTFATDVWYTIRIDFSDLADVKFYVDSGQVSAGQTFDMSNLTTGEAIMQPYVMLFKGADAGLGTFKVDYVRVVSRRS